MTMVLTLDRRCILKAGGPLSSPLLCLHWNAKRKVKIYGLNSWSGSSRAWANSSGVLTVKTDALVLILLSGLPHCNRVVTVSSQADIVKAAGVFGNGGDACEVQGPTPGWDVIYGKCCLITGQGRGQRYLEWVWGSLDIAAEYWRGYCTLIVCAVNITRTWYAVSF